MLETSDVQGLSQPRGLEGRVMKGRGQGQRFLTLGKP